MAHKLIARSAFDRHNTPLGTLDVNDEDVVTGFTPAPGEPERFEQAVLEKWDVDTLKARARLYSFLPESPERDGVKKGAEIEAVSGEIAKTDDDQRVVFGWAYITHDKTGELNIDKSGDFVETIEEIEKSAYDFVLRSRKGDADHTNVHGADMVESVVFTPEKIEKMGIPAGVVPLGWWIGFKVNDDATWQRVKKGELTAFSVHGKGTRKSVE